MARFARICGLAALMLLCGAASAHAWGWRWFGYRSHYWAPVRVVYYPAVVVPTCYPVTAPAPAQIMPYATPKAAPPSQQETSEPPLGSSGSSKPKITESRSQGGKYATATNDRCRVGFWNITSRDVIILVDGQSRSLARNQNMTLELARVFSWQIDGRQRAERVPDGQTTYDIVLRP